MTLLVPNLGAAPAAGGFSMGSNLGAADSTMNMSLDDMIANRRKETVQSSRRGGRSRVSTADRSIATGRAKRSAAVNARRQITTTKKPTKMEVEKEVKVQVARAQKAKAPPTKGAGRVAATGGRRQRAATKAAGPAGGRPKKGGAMKEVKTKKAAVQVAQASQPPTKKAVNAAVQAFRANGFQIPQGAQMVIRFESGAANPPAKGGRGGGNQGGRNANSGGGRGGRGGANKNSNPRNNNNNNNNNNNGGGGGRGRNSNNNRRGRGGRGGGGGARS